MARKLAFLLATAAGMFGLIASESAIACTPTLSNDTCTISNSTQVESASIGGGTLGSWGANVGGSNPANNTADYTTTGLTATYTAGSNGTGTVTLQFATTFANTATNSTGNQGTPGQQLFETSKVEAADIFIQSTAAAAGTIASSYNYGIALGYTADKDYAQNSGKLGAAAGLYENPTYLTSNQVWSGNGTSGLSGTYGGAFSNSSGVSGTCSGTKSGNNDPCSTNTETVVTGGTDLSTGGNDTVCDTATCTPASATTDGLTDGFFGSGSSGTFTVSITGTNASLDIFSDFDIFWGTGDCSNAPIYGNVALDIPGWVGVPEPSSLALLATAALGFEYIRRRKRKGLFAA